MEHRQEVPGALSAPQGAAAACGTGARWFNRGVAAIFEHPGPGLRPGGRVPARRALPDGIISGPGRHRRPRFGEKHLGKIRAGTRRPEYLAAAPNPAEAPGLSHYGKEWLRPRLRQPRPYF